MTSLATEKSIIGTSEGMLVEPFFEQPPTTQAQADRIKAAVMDFPLYLGNLVSRNGQGTLIIAELHDSELAQKAYQSLLSLIEKAPLEAGEELHVAGEGG